MSPGMSPVTRIIVVVESGDQDLTGGHSRSFRGIMGNKEKLCWAET